MKAIEPAIEVSDLTVRFGDFTAVDGISFSVDKGEIFGFLGANGAGKTTTIRVLCGLLKPASGNVKVAGLWIEGGGGAIKKRVGYMSQKFTLYNDLTVEENLAFAAGLRKLPGETLKRRTGELFDFIGFEHSPKTMVKDLPGGIKQEVSLAAAMLHEPEIIFLDEPTSGVAPALRTRFWKLIRRVTGTGKTVIVTTHYMDEAEQCGRIALMRAGKIIAMDSPAALRKKTFPEPLLELDPKERPAGALLETLRGLEGIIQIQPQGMRYHVTVKDENICGKISEALPEGMTARRIPPSLEDVFLRLVEGKDR